MCTSLPDADPKAYVLLSLSWVALVGIAQLQRWARVATHQHEHTTLSVQSILGAVMLTTANGCRHTSALCGGIWTLSPHMIFDDVECY